MSLSPIAKCCINSKSYGGVMSLRYCCVEGAGCSLEEELSTYLQLRLQLQNLEWKGLKRYLQEFVVKGGRAQKFSL